VQLQFIALSFAAGLVIHADAVPKPDRTLTVAQAMPEAPGAAADMDKLTPKERMSRRFPQTVRVGDLIGLPVFDDGARTLGYVREIVRTPQDGVALIVSYSKWFGWFGWDARSVAVPIEAVGIFGRNIASLDMPRSEYAAAPSWPGDGNALASDEIIRVALAKH
jgi:hypothetical protein